LHPIVEQILSFRELYKLLSTYIEKLPELVGEDGRLHAQFLQAGTTTGRMSSQNPNLQNIPVKGEHGRDIRRAFVAGEGYSLVALDYSQIELRIAAGLSGDEKLCEAFKAGHDIHASVAAQVFGVPEEMVDYEMRRRAKVINFGILYGMGVNALRESLGAGVSRDEASKFLSEYFATFGGLARWIEKTKASAKALGYTETLFGRRRYFSGFDSTLPQVRAQAERMAVNAPVQGTQSDIIKLAMVEASHLIEREAPGKARLVLQIHDELVYEIEESCARGVGEKIRAVMQSVAPQEKLSNVPIVSELAIGPNWAELKKL
jgi:DNA polymerase I